MILDCTISGSPISPKDSRLGTRVGALVAITGHVYDVLDSAAELLARIEIDGDDHLD